MKRRFLFLLSFLVIASAGWSYGWTQLSSKSLHAFDLTVDHAKERGTLVTCRERTSVGFPFRLGITCEEPRLVHEDIVDVAFSGFHAQSFVYRPNHQVIDFKSPAEVKIGEAANLLIEWQKARFGSELTTSGLQAATFNFEGASVRPKDTRAGTPDFEVRAEKVQANTRKTSEEEPPNSLVTGARAERIEVMSQRYKLPPVDMDLLALLYDLAPVLDGKVKNPLRYWVDAGGEADIKAVSLRSGDAELYATGWVKLDNLGFVNADLNVDSANMTAFFEQLGPELQQFRVIGSLVDGVVEQLGENVSLNGKPAKRFKVSIRKGFVQIGFIPVGNIPQIDVKKL